MQIEELKRSIKKRLFQPKSAEFGLFFCINIKILILSLLFSEFSCRIFLNIKVLIEKA